MNCFISVNKTRLLKFLLYFSKRTLLIGYCFNGVTSSMLLSSGSLLSVTWFPVSERTTATAVCTMSLQFGIGFGFITGYNHYFKFQIIKIVIMTYI